MHTILEKYVSIANLIADTFGPNCEVVIHDLTMPENSVVYTRNNQVTHREVGQSFNHLIKQVLLSKDFHDDCTSNYVTIAKDGRRIKSSTAIIRDQENKAIGALCVNIDVTPFEKTAEFLNQILGLGTNNLPPSLNGTNEEVDVIYDIHEIVDDLIEKIISRHNIDAMNRDEKISMITFMFDKGIFSIKGSIDKVAEKMKASKTTIYSYLDEIKKQRT